LFRVARMFVIGATVLAAAAGLTFGLFVPSIARADDPQPTTVPTPTLPTPDPAPPKPKPKPAPKPAPPPRPVTHTQVYRPPAAPAPSTRPAATVQPKVRVQPEPKPKKVVKHKKAPVKKKTTVLPKVNVTPPVGGVAGVQSAFQTKSAGGSFNLGSLLIVLGLGVAIACFTIALVPATYLRWRPAAIFVSERQVDLTVVGLALLVAAAFTLFLTKGP
jgi:hypothetical protein